MYRGSKKTVLVFKGRDSKIFDEAHFIVKDNTGAREEDIIKEANRIISEYGNCNGVNSARTKKERGNLYWYVWGLVSGIFMFSLSSLLLSLIT